MKNSKIIVMMLSVSHLIFYTGNIGAMRLPQSQIETRKNTVSRVMAKMKQQQSSQMQQLKPGEFFIYQKGTTNGITVSWNQIKNSKTLVDMLEAYGWITKEKVLDKEELIFHENLWQRDQALIPLPFSIDIIKLVFDDKVDLKSISLNQLAQLSVIEDYLETSRLDTITTILNEQLKEATLEQLVNLFNDNPAIRKPVFNQIFDIVRSICWAVVCQVTADRNNEGAHFEEGYLGLNNEIFSFNSFDNYKGKMIPLRSGSRVLHIPDYKILAKINSTTEKDFIAQMNLPRPIVVRMHDELGIKGLNEHLHKDSLVDFLDLVVEAVQTKYNDFSWRKRWLWLPW